MKKQIDLCVDLALEMSMDRSDGTLTRKDRRKIRTKKKKKT
jgi:hypothetical protein